MADGLVHRVHERQRVAPGAYRFGIDRPERPKKVLAAGSIGWMPRSLQPSRPHIVPESMRDRHAQHAPPRADQQIRRSPHRHVAKLARRGPGQPGGSGPCEPPVGERTRTPAHRTTRSRTAETCGYADRVGCRLLAGLATASGIRSDQLVEPEQVASLVTYLATPLAASLTGHEYFIDDGAINTARDSALPAAATLSRTLQKSGPHRVVRRCARFGR